MHVKACFNYMVVVGSFIFLLPPGLPYYYGNLSTYTNSHFRYCIGESTFDIDPDWLLPFFFVFHMLGTVTVDLWTNKLSRRLVLLICIIMLNAGLFLTFFAVQHSAGLTSITLPMMSGYVMGMSIMVCLNYTKDVLPKHVGMASAVVSCAVGIGASINNSVLTAYINPDNITPDVHLTNRAYFSQLKVLQKVSGVFIALGICALALTSVGCVLQQVSLHFINQREVQMSETNEQTLIVNAPSERETKSATTVPSDNGTCDQRDNTVSEHDSHHHPIEQGHSLKPMEVLRTKSFYYLCAYKAVMTFCHIFVLNYYKSLGQQWIKDDNYLAFIGSFMAVSNAVIRIIAGVFVDTFGVKSTLIFAMSNNVVFLGFWCIAPVVDRWLYFFCCQVLVGSQTTMYLLFPMAALKFYGPKYYATNYGLLMIASVVSSLISPIVFSNFLGNDGYFPIVTIGCVSSTLTLIILICFVPSDK